MVRNRMPGGVGGRRGCAGGCRGRFRARRRTERAFRARRRTPRPYEIAEKSNNARGVVRLEARSVGAFARMRVRFGGVSFHLPMCSTRTTETRTRTRFRVFPCGSWSLFRRSTNLLKCRPRPHPRPDGNGADPKAHAKSRTRLCLGTPWVSPRCYGDWRPMTRR